MATLLLEVIPVSNGSDQDYEAFTIRSAKQGKEILDAESLKLVKPIDCLRFNQWAHGEDIAEMLSMHCGHAMRDASSDRSLLHSNSSGFDYRLSIIREGKHTK